MSTRKSNKNHEALKKEVAKAISKCEAERLNPSMKAVQQIVGGSYSDLCQAVREVKAEAKAREAANMAVPEMSQAVADLFDSVWTEAFTAADAPAAAARQTFLADLKDRDQQVLDLEEMLADLEMEKDKALARADAAEKQATKVDEKCRDNEERMRDLEADLKTLQARLEDRASFLSELRSVAA
ncbi:DNA-binding protein [Tropicimonas sp. TH_r6]|uniref:DNA-binding protein n=1 Tax=Tropicimonas sp. TH_r6 TaxID=3082085 RepID=UPI002952E6C3|nr:DNA-binding protein [Tropicimonas sp. TH_r6]MDV7145939.1 DNA-binding protein [Tropicimonas sp. TH_r6]